MDQHSSSPHHPSAGVDREVALFRARSGAHLPLEQPVRPARAVRREDRGAAAPKAKVKTHDIRQVVVLEVAGRLSDVVEDLDLAIQLALAGGPRGVVCDLSVVSEGAQDDAVELLASAGRHVRDWPGTPVAVASPDPKVREALRADPLGGRLIVTAGILPAVSAVLATPVLPVEWLRLTPHPTAPRASRNFVARVLPDWGLDLLVHSASLVVSELVTTSTIQAGTDMALSLTWNPGALRVTVRDDSPDPPRQWYSELDPEGRGLSVVAGLCRADGVLPTPDGGKVVWAVLDAPLPAPPGQ